MEDKEPDNVISPISLLGQQQAPAVHVIEFHSSINKISLSGPFVIIWTCPQTPPATKK